MAVGLVRWVELSLLTPKPSKKGSVRHPMGHLLQQSAISAGEGRRHQVMSVGDDGGLWTAQIITFSVMFGGSMIWVLAG